MQHKPRKGRKDSMKYFFALFHSGGRSLIFVDSF